MQVSLTISSADVQHISCWVWWILWGIVAGAVTLRRTTITVKAELHGALASISHPVVISTKWQNHFSHLLLMISDQNTQIILVLLHRALRSLCLPLALVNAPPVNSLYWTVLKGNCLYECVYCALGSWLWSSTYMVVFLKRMSWTFIVSNPIWILFIAGNYFVTAITYFYADSFNSLCCRMRCCCPYTRDPQEKNTRIGWRPEDRRASGPQIVCKDIISYGGTASARRSEAETDLCFGEFTAKRVTR